MSEKGICAECGKTDHLLPDGNERICMVCMLARIKKDKAKQIRPKG